MKTLYANQKTMCSKCGKDLSIKESLNNQRVCDNCKCVR